MTYKDLFSIISKPWASINDIKAIGSCGRDAATSVLKHIELDITNNGNKLPNGKTRLVPMTRVIEYFNLDVNLIADMVQKQKYLTKGN